MARSRKDMERIMAQREGLSNGNASSSMSRRQRFEEKYPEYKLRTIEQNPVVEKQPQNQTVLGMNVEPGKQFVKDKDMTDTYLKAMANKKIKDDLDNRYKGYTYNQVKEELKNHKKSSNEYKYLSRYGVNVGYNSLEDYKADLLDRHTPVTQAEKDYRAELEAKKNIFELEHRADKYRGVLDEDIDGEVDVESADNIYKYINNIPVKDKLSNKTSGYRDIYEPTAAEKVLLATNAIVTTDEMRTDYMTDEEKRIYNALYRKDPEEANAFLKDMKLLLDKRATQNREDAYADEVNRRTGFEAFGLGALDTFASTGENLVGGALSTVDRIYSKMLGKEYNPYSGMNSLSNDAMSVRGAIRNDIDENVSEVLGGMYSAATSSVDSTIAAISPLRRGYSFFMGGSAAQQKYRQALEAGIDTDKASMASFLAGVAETLFEFISIEHLVDTSSAADFKHYLVNVLKQGGVEGSEEVATEISNLFTDEMILGNMSDYHRNARQFMEMGYSEADAYDRARRIAIDGIVEAGLSGAFSGGLSSAAYGVSDLRNNIKYGNEINANHWTEDYLNEARAYDSKEVQDSVRGYDETGKTGYLGKMAFAMQDSIAEDLRTGSKEGDVDKVAKAVARNNAMVDIENRDRTHEKVADRAEEIRKADDTITEEKSLVKAYEEEFEDNDSIKKLFEETYEEGQDVSQYYESFKRMVTYAEAGVTFDEMKSKGILTASQATKIYETVYTNKVKALEELASKYRVEGVVGYHVDDSIIDWGDGKNPGGKVKFRNLTQDQKNSILLVNSISKALGVKVVLESSAHGFDANGFYNPEDNSIHIDVYAGKKNGEYLKGAMVAAMSHELTHWAKAKSPALYAELKNQVLSGLATKEGGVESMMKSEKARLLKNHPEYANKTEAEMNTIALDEMIARSCEGMLSGKTSEVRNMLLNMSPEARNSFTGKIKQFINNLRQAIKDALNQFKGYKNKTKEVEYLEQLDGVLASMQKSWDAMILNAAKVNAGYEQAGVIGETVLRDGIGDGGATIIGSDVVQLSEKTYEDGGREYLTDYLNKLVTRGEITKKDADDIIDATDRAKEIFENIREADKNGEFDSYTKWSQTGITVDEEGNKRTVIVQNGDYKMNIDMATVCKKRVALDRVLNALVQSNKLNVVTLTESDVSKINAIINEHEFEIACALCFVDSKRYRVGSWADTFCNGSDDNKGSKKNPNIIHKYGFNEMVESLIPKGSGIVADEFNFTDREIETPKGKLLKECKDSELDFTLIDSILENNDKSTAQYRIASAIKGNKKLRSILNKSEIISSIGLDRINAENKALYRLINSHQGTAKPKFSHAPVAYKNDILMASDFDAEKAKYLGGVRLQSFSDFMANMAFDYVQMISELSAKNLTMHTYTKEPLLVALFGQTGIKINMSLVPKAVQMTKEQEEHFAPLRAPKFSLRGKKNKALKAEYDALCINAGLDENGNYIWENETFPYEVAMDFQANPLYAKNVGTIAVGISDRHIRKLLNDPTIHMVIPYHKSSLALEVAKMRKIDLYNDYTSVQNTRKYVTNDKGETSIKKLDKNETDFDFYGDLYGRDGKKGTNDPIKTADNYLAFCKKMGYVPKFDEFAGEKNYYKLLADFRMYDENGKYAEQQPVKPIYPGAEEFAKYLRDGVVSDGVTYGGLRQQNATEKRLEKELSGIVSEIEDTILPKQFSDKEDYAPVFVSKMSEEIENMKQDKIGSASVVPYLKGKGVKDEEIKWSGIETFLEGKKSVSKAELLEYAKNSMLQLEEKTLSNAEESFELLLNEVESYGISPSYEDWIEEMDGSFSYNRFKGDLYDYLADGDITVDDYEKLSLLADELMRKDTTNWHQYKTEGGTNYREILFKMPNSNYQNNAMETHWGDKGVLAHARIQDFDTPNGKMLFVEEIQSDWHNAGHMNGYENESTKEEKTKEYFKKEMDSILTDFFNEKTIYDKIESVGYHGTGIHMVMNYLIDDEQGRSTIDMLERKGSLFTKSEKDTIKDYQDKYLESYKRWEKAPTLRLIAPDAPFKETYTDYVMKRLLRIAAEDGYDSIGWTTGKMQEERWSDRYAEGYRIEYDQDIPKFMKKYGKQWGATVERENLDETDDEIWAVQITPSMRDSVLHTGQYMYSDKDSNIDSWLDDLSIEDILESIGTKAASQSAKSRKPRRVDEVNKMLKEIGLTFNGTTTAGWTDENIERNLNRYAASNPKYAQAYIAYMKPIDFLNLTMGGNTITVDRIKEETDSYGDLDLSQLSSANIPMFLDIDEGKTTKTVGHEGRHRMMLLGKAGFERVPVLLFNYDNKYSKEERVNVKILPQQFGNGFVSNTRSVVVDRMIPFSNENKDEIVSTFGKGNANANILYSDKSNTIQYSIKDITDENGKDYGLGVYFDSTFLDGLSDDERVELIKEYVKELGDVELTAYDQNGQSYTITVIGSKRFKNSNGKRIPANSDLRRKYIRNNIKQEALAQIDEVVKTSNHFRTLPSTHTHDWIDDNGKNDWEELKTYAVDRSGEIWELKLFISTGSDDKRYLYDVVTKKEEERVINFTAEPLLDTNDNTNPLDVNKKFSDKDSDGNQLSPGQVEFFKESKVRDKNGNLKVMYHGASYRGGFTVFDASMSDDGRSFFFTDNKKIASGYASSDTEYDFKTEYTLKDLNKMVGNTMFIRVEKDGDVYKVNNYTYGPILTGTEFEGTFDDVKDYVIEMYGEPTDRGVYKVYLNLTNPLVIDADYSWWEEIPFDFGNGKEIGTTREIAEYAQKNGYDGVIIDNVIDDAINGRESFYEAIAFKSESIKAVSNENPTNNPDIRFSEKEDYTDFFAELESESHKNDTRTVAEDYDALVQKLRDKRVVADLTKSRIESVAKMMVEKSGTKMSQAEVARRITEIYDGIKNDEGYAAVHAMLHELSMEIAENSSIEADPYGLMILNELKHSKVKLSEEQKKEAKYLHGEKWYQHYRKIIGISNEGTPLDTMFKEWAEKYPGVFTEVGDAEMMSELDAIIDTLETTHKVMSDAEIESVATYLDAEILNQYWNATLRDYGDVDKKIAKMNQKHKERIQQIRASYGEMMTNYRNRVNARTDEKVEKIREYYKGIYKKVRENRDYKLKQQKLQRDWYDAERRATREKRAVIAKIATKVIKLKRMLDQNTAKEHIPEQFKNATKAVLSAIDFGQDTKKAKELSNALSELRTQFLQMFKDESLPIDLPPDTDERIEQLQKVVDGLRNGNGFVLNDMTIDQLKSLNSLLRAFKTAISKADAALGAEKAMRISEMAEPVIGFLDEIGKIESTNMVKSFLNWKNLTPIYAFERFGQGGKMIFDELVQGSGRLAMRIAEIESDARKMYSDEEVKEWEEHLNTFEFDGKTVNMTDAQLMSLYAHMKREQSKSHIEGAGIRVEDFSIGRKQYKNAEGFAPTQEQVEEMLSKLSDRQKEVASAIQDYMSGKMSDWGNEISMKRWGIKFFLEKNYIPIEIDVTSFGRNAEEQNRLNDSSIFRLLNLGFTKPLMKNANNRIMIRSMFDVFAAHASDMALYNTMALPILDCTKWLNYKSDSGDDRNPVYVKSAMNKAYGSDAANYVNTLLLDLTNGRKAKSSDLNNISQKFLRNYKLARVAFNIRVALLQPTSYLRSAAILEAKYLAKAVTMSNAYDEALEHSGTAMWKNMGMFDTNISRSVTDRIKGGQTKKDMIVDASLKLAEKGDQITWSALWNACKLKVEAEQNLTKGSEKYWKAVDELFTEVVYKTQVMDSTLTRSQLMREPNAIAQMMTSFMSEPTVSYNMLLSGYTNCQLDIRRGKSTSEALRNNSNYILRGASAYASTAALAAFVEALVDTFRRLGDDEEWTDKMFEEFLENFKADIGILQKIPVIKDFVSIMSGYSAGRMDQQWITDTYKAYKEYEKLFDPESKASAYKLTYNSLSAVSDLTGLALATPFKDVVAMWNDTIGRTYPSMRIK